MALSTYTGGSLSYNYSSSTRSLPISYFARPTPAPQYNHLPRYNTLRHRKKAKRKEETHRGLAPAGGEGLAYDPDRDGIKRGRKKGQMTNEIQVIEEGEENPSQQPDGGEGLVYDPDRDGIKRGSKKEQTADEIQVIEEGAENPSQQPGGGVGLVYDPDRDGIKRRRKRRHTVKIRVIKEGAEYPSQQPVEDVAARCGEDVTLPCRAPRPDSVDGLEWTRTDLERYVFLYKDGKADLTEQDEAFRGRAQLKDGTAALVLQNITRANSGTYECRFINQDTGVSKRAIITKDPDSVVRLSVQGACTGEEEKKEEDNDENKGGVRPAGTQRHHYVTYGVFGAFGLVVAALIVIIIL